MDYQTYKKHHLETKFEKKKKAEKNFNRNNIIVMHLGVESSKWPAIVWCCTPPKKCQNFLNDINISMDI